MTATEEYISVLAHLKAGELTLLRTHAGQGLDESVEGFDLFAGLWWPLRERNQRAPRRSVAWLVAKLYACSPIPQSPGDTLAHQLRRSRPYDARAEERHRQRLDRMLTAPLDLIEPSLRWALKHLASADLPLDWVRLTDDLSIWEREHTRLLWAEQYLGINERM